MTVTFNIGSPSSLGVPGSMPLVNFQNQVFLSPSNWDDYGHQTLFSLVVFDPSGVRHDVGSVKIGYTDQKQGATSAELLQQFSSLGAGWFSVGQDADYYRYFMDKFDSDFRRVILEGLADLVFDADRYKIAESEDVFRISLLRNVSNLNILQQYHHILEGKAPLTEYDFRYISAPSPRYSGYELDFRVVPNSTPSSNIHVLIGRNGVGKTTLLNGMVNTICRNQSPDSNVGQFIDIGATGRLLGLPPLTLNYFSAVVSVAFSAFDPFDPPAEQTDSGLGTCYYYVGLKKRSREDEPQSGELKSPTELQEDFCTSVIACLSFSGKKPDGSRRFKNLKATKILRKRI